jgi:hypothetical protein
VPGADPAEVEKSLLAMSDKYVGPEIEDVYRDERLRNGEKQAVVIMLTICSL